MASRKRYGAGEGMPAGRGKKAGHILMAAVLAAAVLITLVAAGFLILQVLGKGNLYGSASSDALVMNLSDMAGVEFGGDVQAGEGGEDWQPGDVRYNGIHYRYNEDILTFLFLGIDRMGEVTPVADGMDGGQSDAIFLLALNPHKKEAAVIGIPRDTMTEVETYSRSGSYTGTMKTQLCLQHGYGDGAQLSCERSVEAVSGLFYGLAMGTAPLTWVPSRCSTMP